MRPDVIKSTYWGFASGFIRNDKTNLRILYFAADWSFFVHGKCIKSPACADLWLPADFSGSAGGLSPFSYLDILRKIAHVRKSLTSC